MFKIGDVVGCSDFECKAIYRGLSNNTNLYHVLERMDGNTTGGGQNGWWQVKFNEIIKLAGSDKPAKVLPPKFLLQYELDEDPVEEFQTITEVKKRLQELSKYKTLKRDRIFVYEIKKKVKVELEDKVVIKGL